MKVREVVKFAIGLLFPALLMASGPAFAQGAKTKKAASSSVTKQVKKHVKDAQTKSKQAAKGGGHKVSTKNAKSKLGREFVFDGSTVNGQYHSAGEAVAKVEQEKKMNDLVGMRRDFKDRLGAEKERLQRGEEP